MYSKCVQCGSTTIIPDVSLRDEGAYAALNHQIVIEGNPTAIFRREPIAVQTRAYICGTCGYVALFVESAHRLYETYQHAQALLVEQRIQDSKLPRVIESTAEE